MRSRRRDRRRRRRGGRPATSGSRSMTTRAAPSPVLALAPAGKPADGGPSEAAERGRPEGAAAPSEEIEALSPAPLSQTKSGRATDRHGWTIQIDRGGRGRWVRRRRPRGIAGAVTGRGVDGTSCIAWPLPLVCPTPVAGGPAASPAPRNQRGDGPAAQRWTGQTAQYMPPPRVDPVRTRRLDQALDRLTMWRAEMPKCSSSSSGLPLRGISRTASRCTAYPDCATAAATASPMPPAG